MLTKARLLGHPIHIMLMPFPIGAFGAATVFDLIDAVRGEKTLAKASYANMLAGVASGAAAAVFGLTDWVTSVPRRTRADQIGALHGLGNTLVMGCYVTSLLLRRRNRGKAATPTAVALEVTGFGLMLGTAWLGTELVNRLGIGVYKDANVNAPSSLVTDKTVAAKVGNGASRAAAQVASL